VRGRDGSSAGLARGVIVLLLSQPEWAARCVRCCGCGWVGCCVRAAESSLPVGVSFKAGHLLQGLKLLFITVQQTSLLSAECLKVTASAQAVRLLVR